jgi:hypothetical protein
MTDDGTLRRSDLSEGARAELNVIDEKSPTYAPPTFTRARMAGLVVVGDEYDPCGVGERSLSVETSEAGREPKSHPASTAWRRNPTPSLARHCSKSRGPFDFETENSSRSTAWGRCGPTNTFSGA